MFQKKPAKKFNFGFPSSKKSTETKKAETNVSQSNTNPTPLIKRKLGGDSDQDNDDVESTKKQRQVNTIQADDEQDFLASAGIGPSSSNIKEAKKTDNNEKEEDVDPLDAFMADMNEQQKSAKAEPKARRDEFEEEDDMESYIRHMKEEGVTVGKVDNRSYLDRNENADSDDEVYATAARIDAELNQDSDGNEQGPVKREIEPLARINHDDIEYPEIEKYFYEEHPDIASLSAQKITEVRNELGLHVTGSEPPAPCVSFAHFGFDEDVMATIIKAGYTEPSAIQKQAIPVALQGRDIIGIAKTGSGKTAAFVLPMLVHIMDQEELAKGDGPIGLIMAPTRELVGQIYAETKKFAKAYGLKVAAVYGGASKMAQFKQLRSSTVEILVATPGRLIDMIKMKATNLRRVSYLVLDEADRMFDLGFEPQVRSVCDNVRPDRQALLFSATFPRKVEYLAREVTENPVRISVGTTGQANEDITQVIIVLDDEMLKWDWVIRQLPRFCSEGSIIIFVSRKGAVDILANNISESGFPCGALHGDLMQYERDKVLRDFRANKYSILVATDVAARGLDIKAVKNVVNYDIARDIDSHVHRIGRTGRAGEKGTAYTLITRKEDRFAGDLVKNLESSGQPVPSELMDLAMTNPKFKSSRIYRASRGRGRGRGGRGGHGRGGGGFKGHGNRHRGGGITGANMEPLPPRSSSSSSRTFSSSGGLRFQKASTDEAGARGLNTTAGVQQSNRRWN
ncbi:P-loop containing nucleoside triphosphate hydrolase protein [Circinella umbellata]|nr:P-loop containing nucleoside triphosphate hydrolase protein [Circinella umbellata]